MKALLVLLLAAGAALAEESPPQFVPRSKFGELTMADTRQLLEQYNNYAWALATDPEALDGKAAVEIAECMALFGIDSLPHHQLDTIAACHARAGDFAKAIDFQSRAIAAVAGNRGDLAGYQQRLQLFRSSKPYQDGAAVKLVANRLLGPGDLLMGEGFIRPGGQKSGHWKLYYANGRAKAEGGYLGNAQFGTWRQWRDDGSLESEGLFWEGRRIGRWREWHANGQLAFDGGYFEESPGDGRRCGFCQFFHENGQPRLTRTFVDGEPVGPRTRWHANGAKAEEVVYVSDIQALWRRWDEDGKLLSERHLPEVGDNRF